MSSFIQKIKSSSADPPSKPQKLPERLINPILASEISSKNTKIAFMGSATQAPNDGTHKQLGKAVFIIKKDSFNPQYSILVYSLGGKLLTSKQVTLYLTYEVNQILGEIKWSDSKIISTLFKFTFDRQQVAILVKIALQQAISQLKTFEKKSVLSTISQTIQHLQKQLELSSLQKRKLSHLTKKEKAQRLQRLWKLESLGKLTVSEKLKAPLKSTTKKITKQTIQKISQTNLKHKKNKQRSERNKKKQKIIQQSKQISVEQAEGQIKKSPIQSEKKQVSFKKVLKKTKQAAIHISGKQYLNSAFNYIQPSFLQDQNALIQDFNKQEQVLQRGVDVKSIENRNQYRIFYQAREQSKIYICIQNYVLKKSLCRNNTLNKRYHQFQLTNPESSKIKPQKIFFYCHDTKLITLASCGRIFLGSLGATKTLTQLSFDKQIMIDLCKNKSSLEKKVQETFLAVSHKGVYILCPWKKQINQLKTIAIKNQNSTHCCIVSLSSGGFAIGYDNGKVVVFDETANKEVECFNFRKQRVLRLQTSADGAFLLITYSDCLFLVPINIELVKSNYFKCPKYVELKPTSDLVQKFSNSNIETVVGKFNQNSIGKQQYVIWGFGDVVMIWKMFQMINQEQLEYRSIRAKEMISQVQFKFNDPKKVLIATMSGFEIETNPYT